MKKIFLFLNLFGIIILIHAQPSLSIINTPQSGSTYLFNYCGTDSISVGESAENVIWNFENITILSDTLSIYYTNDTAYDAFPGYEYPPWYFDTSLFNLKSYLYHYNINSERYSIAYQSGWIPGWGNIPCYSNRTIFNIPFSYNDSIFENWNCPPVNNAITEIKYDAYGDLILPNNIYNNVLRIYTKEKQEFVAYQTMHNYYDTTWTNKYEWYTDTSEIPVFSINYYKMHSWHYGMLTVIHDTTVLIYDMTIAPSGVISYPINNLNVNIFPNPIKDKFKVEIESDISEIINFEITDLLGHKLVDFGSRAINEGYNKFEFSINGISNGHYLFITDNSVRKIINKIVIKN
jgi:hypothetical protein